MLVVGTWMRKTCWLVGVAIVNLRSYLLLIEIVKPTVLPSLLVLALKLY
jgi:hypothetical protein